jgi:hypothetical protein
LRRISSHSNGIQPGLLSLTALIAIQASLARPALRSLRAISDATLGTVLAFSLCCAMNLRQSPDKLDGKPAWTIELLSGGHAVTLPPSIHPSGQPYEWVNGGLAHVEALPEALLHAVAAIRQSRPAGTADAVGAWPAPKPIIAELKPMPAFDTETLLPEALRAWIIDEAERMPCPPDFVAAAALVALGSIVGARCAMKPRGPAQPADKVTLTETSQMRGGLRICLDA